MLRPHPCPLAPLRGARSLRRNAMAGSRPSGERGSGMRALDRSWFSPSPLSPRSPAWSERSLRRNAMAGSRPSGEGGSGMRALSRSSFSPSPLSPLPSRERGTLRLGWEFVRRGGPAPGCRAREGKMLRLIPFLGVCGVEIGAGRRLVISRFKFGGQAGDGDEVIASRSPSGRSRLTRFVSKLLSHKQDFARFRGDFLDSGGSQ